MGKIQFVMNIFILCIEVRIQIGAILTLY